MGKSRQSDRMRDRDHAARYASRGWVAIWLVLLVTPAAAQPSATTAPAEPMAVWRMLLARPAPAPPPAVGTAEHARIALGMRLFADRRLSGPGTRSCATCHRPERAFTDGRAKAASLSGQPLGRNTPTLWNLAAAKSFYWDGRAPSLEAQARVPLEAHDEMAADWTVVLPRLVADAKLVAAFASAFPDSPAISDASVIDAIAAYERSLVSPPTRFDAWIGGQDNALDAREQRGFRLFVGKAGCVQCHVGWRFTDDRFHDIGLASADPGRGAIPGGVPELKAFKTPTLREIGRTAPYMHDGSLATLDAVLDHYTGKFIVRPGLSANMKRNLRLSARDRADLIAFLAMLTTR